jgi:hypothetical protein
VFNYRLFPFVTFTLLIGCTAVSNTGYYRQCGESKNNPQGTKITTHSVVMQSVPTEKTFYIATEKGGYLILLKSADLLRYIAHYQDSQGLAEQINSVLPLRDFIDLNRFRLTGMIDRSENSLSWAQIFSIAEMLENGDAAIIDIDNDRGRHGLIRKLSVASIENQYGKWREFCINDDDNFNTGWPIYKVSDKIVN